MKLERLSEGVERVLVSEEDLEEIIDRLGRQITQDYDGYEVLAIGLLKGATLFMIDLIRAIDLYVEIDFMDVSSYDDGFESSGQVRIIRDIETDVRDRHVLIIEDIVDTGRTLKHVVDILKLRGAASVKVVTLLDKPERRVIKSVQADYIGVTIPNEFVVGYGLDYKQYYRNLPYVGVLKEEVYQSEFNPKELAKEIMYKKED